MFEDNDFDETRLPSNVNWRRWESMLNFIKSLKPKAINMASWYEVDTEEFPRDEDTYAPACTVGQAAAHCNTAGCFAGWIFLKNAKRRDIIDEGSVEDFAIDYLRLNSDEAYHAFHAEWTNTGMDFVKKSQLVKYLKLALKKRDVLVRID